MNSSNVSRQDLSNTRSGFPRGTWMDIRTWRFWFRTKEEAERVCLAFRVRFGLDRKLLAVYKRNPPKHKILLGADEVRHFGKEVRVRFTADVNRPPDLGVLPAGPRLIRVHFCNMQFYCTWFVYRQTVYDLTFDGKCRYNARTDKCYLYPEL